MSKPKQKRMVKELTITERRRRATEHRKNGKNLREIAEIMGCSHETIRKDLQVGLEELRRDTMVDALEYRAIQVKRREEIIAAHREIAADPTDEKCKQSADIVDKNETAIAKLMGTDQPILMETKTEVTGGNAGPLTINLVATELGTGDEDGGDTAPDSD